MKCSIVMITAANGPRLFDGQTVRITYRPVDSDRKRPRRTTRELLARIPESPVIARHRLRIQASGLLAARRLKAVREQSGIMTPFKLGLLAQALAAGGDEAAPAVIEEALALTAQGERWSESELVRIKGIVLLARNRAAAEQCFHQAMRIANRNYVLELGSVVGSGTSAEMAVSGKLEEAYLGRN